jgi:two-component system OmpR family response regulator/two-component system copper resistance phosphate regulon response regulator CusR
MLPDMPGMELLKKLRSSQNHVPVLILTALGSIDDRVSGLKAGADDYLVKPFAFAELSARLDAIRRRASRGTTTSLQVGDLRMELTTRKVERDGRDIDLTPTEFRLLEYLMRSSDQVVTRRMLCEHLWEADWEGVTNVIEVHINRLRSKINKGDEPQMIHTVRGSGYVLRAT